MRARDFDEVLAPPGREACVALEVTVDLGKREVRFGGDRIACSIPDSARTALVTGEWDFLAQLLEGAHEIRETADTLPYMRQFA